MAASSIATISFIHHQRFLKFVSPKTRFSVLISRSSAMLSPRLSMQELIPPLPTQSKDVDLKLTIDRSGLVYPMEKTERRTNFLSNLDHLFNFMTHTVQFFDMNPNFPFETVVTKYETAFRKILVYYDFLAGRLKNTGEGRLEIDCNSAGAGFVVASSKLRLEELGDLVQPKQCYQHLTPRKLQGVHPRNQPLIIIQVTSFMCGGFTIGFSINHIALDGVSSIQFANNMGSMMENNNLVLHPYNNRLLLAARSPPHISFLHPEFISLESKKRENVNQIPLKATYQKLDCKVLNLSSKHITMLIDLAKMDNERNARNPNIFSLVAAHIWRCTSLAKIQVSEPKGTSTLLFAINMRPRLEPRLPTSYSGNGVYFAHSTITYRELEKGPISHITDVVSQGAIRMTNEYARSVIDYIGVNKMVPHGNVLLTSWLKHGMDGKYPWGRAKWSTPVLPNYGNNAIILLPNTHGTIDGGINVLVSLPDKEMKTFQDIFYKF